MASESSSSLATSHEVDAVSNLDKSLGDEESCSSVVEGARNAVVSLLSRLKSPCLSDFARKKKSRLILLQASILVVDQQLLN